jgi:hypothetical protein
MKFYENCEVEYNQALTTTYEETKSQIYVNSKEGYIPLGHNISILSVPEEDNKINSNKSSKLLK